jgi:ABC-2 type transport system ATP-binding protein
LTLNVREVLALVGQDIDAALANTADIGVALNVKGLLTKQVGACSAGMKQRVAIACAFAAGRDIVILDEPFNWLDPVAAYDLKQLLRARVDDGLTLITALHDLSSFTRLCDVGAIMVDGQVAIELDRQQLQSAEIDFVGFERRMIDLLRASKGSVSPNDSN